MTILQDDHDNPFTPAPAIRHEQVDGWDLFLSEELVNTGKHGGRFNTLFIRSPEGLYKITINGGLKSDFKNFLNSLEISGQQLQFQYDQAGQFQSVRFQ